MKKYLIIIAVLFLVTIMSHGQVKVLNDTLIKERKDDFAGPGSGGYTITYTDVAECPEYLPRGKDANDKIVDIGKNDLNSIEKFNQIKLQIFTVEEMKYLAANNCYCQTIVYSTGKIVSASIVFFNANPDVNQKKLIEFSRRIKEDLSFDIEYVGNVTKPGYLTLSWKAFPEYSDPPKLKK